MRDLTLPLKAGIIEVHGKDLGNSPHSTNFKNTQLVATIVSCLMR